MNPDCLTKLTLTQVLPLLLNPVLDRRRTAGKTGTRMCLLLKATDAKPKHSFSRLQRLLQTSIAECLQLHEPKHPFFSYINAYKALSFSSQYIQDNCILSRILLPLLLLYFWQPKAWMGEMDMHSAHLRPNLNRDNTQQVLKTEVAPSLASTPLQFLLCRWKKGSRNLILVILVPASCSFQELNASRQFRVCSPEDSGSITCPARRFGEPCVALPELLGAPAARLVKHHWASQPCSLSQHPEDKGRQ